MSREEYIQSLTNIVMMYAKEIPSDFAANRNDLVRIRIKAVKDNLHLIEHEIDRGI